MHVVHHFNTVRTVIHSDTFNISICENICLSTNFDTNCIVLRMVVYVFDFLYLKLLFIRCCKYLSFTASVCIISILSSIYSPPLTFKPTHYCFSSSVITLIHTHQIIYNRFQLDSSSLNDGTAFSCTQRGGIYHQIGNRNNSAVNLRKFDKLRISKWFPAYFFLFSFFLSCHWTPCAYNVNLLLNKMYFITMYDNAVDFYANIGLGIYKRPVACIFYNNSVHIIVFTNGVCMYVLAHYVQLCIPFHTHTHTKNEYTLMHRSANCGEKYFDFIYSLQSMRAWTQNSQVCH